MKNNVALIPLSKQPNIPIAVGKYFLLIINANDGHTIDANIEYPIPKNIKPKIGINIFGYNSVLLLNINQLLEYPVS